MIRRLPILFLAWLLSTWRLLGAQCPDGRPPPCGPPRASTRALDPNVIAILPFRVTGADTSLAEGMAELLAAEFTGEGAPRAVDPGATWRAWRGAGGAPLQPLTQESAVRVARQLGAGQALLGSVVGAGGRLTLSASIVGVPDGGVRVRPEPLSGPPDSLPILLRGLTTGLLARRARAEGLGGHDPGTFSPEALRAYIAGQAAFRRGRYGEARRDLERAVELDSGFTLASLAAVRTARWAGGSGPESPRIRRLAWVQRDRLSTRDRAVLVMYLGSRYPEPTPTAERLAAAERAADAFPDNLDVWDELGELYFHSGVQLGHPDAPERAAAAWRRALALDSTFSGPLLHMMFLAAARGDTAELRRFGERYLATSPSEFTTVARWRLAVTLRDWRGLERELEHIESGTVPTFELIAELWDSIGMAYADRLLAAAARNATTQRERQAADALGVLVNLNRGRPRAARAADPWFAGTLRFGYQVLAWLYGDGDSTIAAQDVRTYEPVADAPLASEPDERLRQYRAACVVEQWRAWQGHRATLDRAIERLDSAGTLQDSARTVAEARTCAAALRALAAVQAQDANADDVVARFDSVIRSGAVHRGAYGGLDWELLLLAKLYEMRGDVTRALVATRRRSRDGTYPSAFFLSASLRQEGRLAALAGDREGAIRAYRWYLTLMSDPEPALIPRRDSVRAELARLEAGRR